MESTTSRNSTSSRLRSGLVLGAVLFATALSGVGPASAECEAKPIVAKIHADWCGTCRATKPVWEKVKADLSDEATMVEFDVTDRASYTTAVADAERLEISDFLHEFRRRTGAIAILDCKSRKPRVVLSGERDFEKYREAIREANEG